MIIKPLKKFGQNFLIDQNIVHKLIEQLDLCYDDFVIEIGPGQGAITKVLCNRVNNLVAIEIDSRVIDYLNSKFNNLKLINADIRNIKFSNFITDSSRKIKIIGNIPFNLTGDILFKLIEEKQNISDASLIIPFDIAKRIIAKPNSKEYGILTVIFNYFSNVSLIRKVSKNVFLPKPNIDAAILHINFFKEENPNIDKKLFIQVVKAAFGNRRKTLLNSLRNSIFKNCNFNNFQTQLSKRAEDLNISDFIKLTEEIQFYHDT